MSGLTQDGTMLLGTPEYMSPEQTLNAAKADIRADIYSDAPLRSVREQIRW